MSRMQSGAAPWYAAGLASLYDCFGSYRRTNDSVADHPTITSSCVASTGRARKDSSRLCSRIKAMDALKFSRHSSCVTPCPLAPGTSAQ